MEKNFKGIFSIQSLNLIDYLLKFGNKRCLKEFKEEIYTIKKLYNYTCYDEHQDKGLSIREKAKTMVELLEDDEKMLEERD